MGRAALMGEKAYERMFPAAGLSKEGIAALRAESELARKVTPEAQLLLTGPQAKLPGTSIPVTQAGEGITNLVQPARMVPPAEDASRLEQMAAASNARKAAQAAQGADTGVTVTKAGSLAQEASAVPSAAEKIQTASMLREAEHAAQVGSAASRGQAAKTGLGLASAAAGAAGDLGGGLGGAGVSYETGFEDFVKQLPKDEKKEIVDMGKSAVKETGEKTSKFAYEDLLAIGLAIMGGNSPFAAVNIGQGGLQGLAMRQARLKEEADTTYKEALAKHYGVDPFVQRLNALKDPENAKMYKQMKEMEREPMTKEALWKQFMASPTAMALDPKDIPTAFQRYVQSYESVLGPIGGLPQGVTVTPRTS